MEILVRVQERGRLRLGKLAHPVAVPVEGGKVARVPVLGVEVGVAPRMSVMQ